MNSDQDLNDLMDQVKAYANDEWDDDDILNAAIELHELNQYYAAARDRGREFQRNLIEQSGGQVNPDEPGRLDFDFERISQDRNKRFNINATRYRATMRQTGNLIANSDLAAALREGLHRSISQALNLQNLSNNHRLFFHVYSDRLHNGNFHGTGLTVRDWKEDTEKADAVFNTLAATLNSNEDFEMNDSFHVEIVTIPPRPAGRGQKRTRKPGHQSTTAFKIMKKSVVTIKNPNDDLCAARALVVARAYVDKHPSYASIRNSGKKLQKTLAENLHENAGSPKTPVGWEELKQYQAALPDYRIVVCYAV